MRYRLSTAVLQSSTLTALYCLGLLSVLHEYACATDLSPRTRPPSKLDSEPFEVHCKG